jgi:thiamine biosynthesis lipoprotein
MISLKYAYIRKPNTTTSTRSNPVWILALITIVLFEGCSDNTTWVRNQGTIFGTTYLMTYENPDTINLHKKVLLALDSVNQSLSTYDSTSVISQFNRSNKATKTDIHFQKVIKTAQQITRATNGAFEITVAPLVNAWGFGFTNKQEITPTAIDSLKKLVGMQFIELTNDSIIPLHKGVMVDASAIAKGYGVDVAAATLARYGCKNYMVEIGGEIATRGHNPGKGNWRIGIDRPIDDPTASKRELQLIIELSGQSLATSGNYRQFYINEEDGKKYAHTIDPVTGYPVDHSLLSASIIADKCMVADAYATACMVMGLNNSLELLKKHPEIEGCFIYDTKDGMKVTWTDGFETYIAKQ